MKRIEYLLKARRISYLEEKEKARYLDFFSNSYKENLEHSKCCLKKFPRWSIISGYYAMHDIAKLFLADKFNIKVEFNVHETTIEVFKELIKDKKIIEMLSTGYNELLRLLNDLTIARKQRTSAQYYTGAEYRKEKYKEDAKIFILSTAVPFINRIKELKNAD